MPTECYLLLIVHVTFWWCIHSYASRMLSGRLAYECIHTMKKKKRSKGACAIKLDMHKAYDRVEWIFLEKIMSKLGFDHCIRLIMACVSSIESNSIIVRQKCSHQPEVYNKVNLYHPISFSWLLKACRAWSAKRRIGGGLKCKEGWKVLIWLEGGWIAYLKNLQSTRAKD